MKIRFITSHAGHRAKAGDEVTLSESVAKELISRRYAVPVKETTEKAVAPAAETTDKTTKKGK